MNERHRDLHEILDEMHDALEDSSTGLRPDEREHLASTLAEIRDVLGGSTEAADPAGTSPAHDSLIERLRTGLESLEDRHPRLTAVVGRVADSLADLGI